MFEEYELKSATQFLPLQNTFYLRESRRMPGAAIPGINPPCLCGWAFPPV